MILKEQAVLVTTLTFAKNTKNKAKIIILITTICITSNDYIGLVYKHGIVLFCIKSTLTSFFRSSII